MPTIKPRFPSIRPMGLCSSRKRAVRVLDFSLDIQQSTDTLTNTYHQSPMQTVTDISQLAAAIESIQYRTSFKGDQPSSPQATFMPTGWLPIDHALGGGLRYGAIHEWFTEAAIPLHIPPLAILIHLAWQAITSAPNSSSLI